MLELRTTKVTIVELIEIKEERLIQILNTTMMKETMVFLPRSIEELLPNMDMIRREEIKRNTKMKDTIQNHSLQNGLTTVTISNIKTREHQSNIQRELRFMEVKNTFSSK